MTEPLIEKVRPVDVSEPVSAGAQVELPRLPTEISDMINQATLFKSAGTDNGPTTTPEAIQACKEFLGSEEDEGYPTKLGALFGEVVEIPGYRKLWAIGRLAEDLLEEAEKSK